MESLYIEENIEHFYSSAFHAQRIVDNRLRLIGEKNLQILQAVFVTAAVVHSACIDADRFFKAICMIRRVEIRISHNNPPIIMIKVVKSKPQYIL